MKKLGIIIAAASLAIATPVFACPHDEAPKTADKAPQKDEKGQDKAKEAPKKETAPAGTAKAKDEPKKDTAKKPDKVSQK